MHIKIATWKLYCLYRILLFIFQELILLVLLNAYVLGSDVNVLNRRDNASKVIKVRHSQSLNPAEQSSFPCKKRQITQYFSVGNSPYTPVLINICSGGCLSISVPSNSTFLQSLCMSCQDTGKVLKDVVFFKGTKKETTMQVESVTGCRCQLCK